MAITAAEMLEKLKEVDEVALLELLDISSEDIVERFSDRIDDKIDELLEEFDFKIEKD